VRLSRALSCLAGLRWRQPCHVLCPAAGGCELGGRPTHEIFRKREVAYRRRLGCAPSRPSRCASRWRQRLGAH